MAKNFLINGDSKNSLSPFDRGLAFGDGVFRTFLVKDGNPINWKNQYQKLSQDLKAIDIKSPSKKTLLTEIQKLFPAKGIFISKIIVTRGESQTGYDFNEGIKPTRILLKIDFVKFLSLIHLLNVFLVNLAFNKANGILFFFNLL